MHMHISSFLPPLSPILRELFVCITLCYYYLYYYSMYVCFWSLLAMQSHHLCYDALLSPRHVARSHVVDLKFRNFIHHFKIQFQNYDHAIL